MARVKGPKDGRFLQANMNGDAKRGKNSLALKQTKVLILVSIVGNEYCSGKYLKAMIERASAEHREVTVLLADEVYWHNLREKPESPEQEEQTILKQQAIELGDKFIKENYTMLCHALGLNSKAMPNSTEQSADDILDWLNQQAKNGETPLKILRWHQWVHEYGDDYPEKIQMLLPYYDTDSVLKDSIDKTAVEFSERHNRDENRELWQYRSYHYLKEEAPAVMYAAAMRDYHFIAYPGEYFEPFKATKAFFIGPDARIGDSPLRLNVPPNDVAGWLEVFFNRDRGHTIFNIDPTAVKRSKKTVNDMSASEEPPEAQARILFEHILNDETLTSANKLELAMTVFYHIRQQLLNNEPPEQNEKPSIGCK